MYNKILNQFSIKDCTILSSGTTYVSKHVVAARLKIVQYSGTLVTKKIEQDREKWEKFSSSVVSAWTCRGSSAQEIIKKTLTNTYLFCELLKYNRINHAELAWNEGDGFAGFLDGFPDYRKQRSYSLVLCFVALFAWSANAFIVNLLILGLSI